MKFFSSINQLILRDLKSQLNITNKLFYKNNFRVQMWVDLIDLNTSGLYGTFLQSFLFFEELLLVKPTILKIKVKKNRKNRQKTYQVGFKLTNSFKISRFLNYILYVVLPLDLKYNQQMVSFINGYFRLNIHNLNSFLGTQAWYFSLVNIKFYIDLFLSKKCLIIESSQKQKLIDRLLLKSYETLLN